MGNRYCGCKNSIFHEDNDEYYDRFNNCIVENIPITRSKNKKINNTPNLLKRKLNKNNSSTLAGNYSFLNDYTNNSSFEIENLNQSSIRDPNSISKNYYKYKKYDSLDSILLNRRNDENEKSMLFDKELNISNIIKNEKNSILIQKEIKKIEK